MYLSSMTIDSIITAAYHRSKPKGMTLAESKLYYAIALLYEMHHLKAISVEEGRKKKAEVIEEYKKELSALDLMKQNPGLTCREVLKMLEDKDEL